MLKRIASLAACCAFLWAVSLGLFLLFCQFRGIKFTADADISSADQSFRLYFLSAGNVLRTHLHTTWLFLVAFAALGIASVVWITAEKWQAGSKWTRQEGYWMAWFSAALGSSAILYGLGTNGVVPKKFAASVTITDVLSIGLVLAVPVLLWSRWRRLEVKADGAEPEVDQPGSRYSRSLLGLEDEHSSAPLIDHAPVPAATVMPPAPDEAALPTHLIDHAPEPAVADLAPAPLPDLLPAPTVDLLTVPFNPPVESPQSDLHQQIEQTIAQSEQPVALAAEETGSMEAMSVVGAATETAATEATHQETAAAPAASFRDQLAALNTSWQKIEETGKEVEDWFRWQQERVVAHLERNTGKQSQPLPFDFSRDFLEQKMRRVDEEWITIHQAVREMNLWLENSNPHKEQGEVPKAG